jgi:hypothetical protein
MKTIDQVKELKKTCYISFDNLQEILHCDKKNYDFYNKIIAYLETEPNEAYLKKALIQLNEKLQTETNKKKLEQINEQIKSIEFILN